MSKSVSGASRADGTEYRLDPVVREAQERFGRCEEFESNARKLFLEDLRFANADPDNMYQWDSAIRTERQASAKPCLTINKVRQHCLSITNDMRQNKPGIKYRATGSGASFQAAQGLNALVKRIEDQSNAQAAYDTAAMFQVQGGLGWILLETRYASETSFDQDIYIKRCTDPLRVYLDPDSQELDGSDARFGFVFEDLEEKDFLRKYPEYKNKGDKELGFGPANSWRQDGKIRVCDYYRVVETPDVLIQTFGEGAIGPVLASTLGKEIADALIAEPGTLTRETTRRKVEWVFIAGSTVCEKRDWPSRYIPCVPVLGEQSIIDGKLDRKGHTRAMKDPQRMYNYWSSSAVEFGALQSKTPYIAPLKAIEGLETYWNTANTTNHAVLPYNHIDDDGNPVELPRRQEPPVAAPVALQGMQTAQMELELVSGQFAAQMGQPGNERTGAALNARQRQGDRATFHYVDGLATAIRHVGRIVLDLIPKIYDTDRVMTVLSEDGAEFQLTLDPGAGQAAQVQMDQEKQQIASMVLNPLIGEYAVVTDVGPGYATKRAEAFEAFTLMLTQAPAISQIIGDLMFRAGDFPMADEAANRLRRMVPPQALGSGPTPQEEQLMGQLQQSQDMISKLLLELEETRLKLRGKAEKRDIDAYRAVTERLDLFAEQIQRSMELMRDTQVDAHSIDLNRIQDANTSEIVGLMGQDEMEARVATAAQGKPSVTTGVPALEG